MVPNDLLTEATTETKPSVHALEGLQVLLMSSREWEPPRVEREVPIAYGVIERYANAAIRKAVVEEREGAYHASIEGFLGVWAEGENIVDTLEELREVVSEWLILKLIDGDHDIPVIADIDLRRFSH